MRSDDGRGRRPRLEAVAPSAKDNHRPTQPPHARITCVRARRRAVSNGSSITFRRAWRPSPHRAGANKVYDRQDRLWGADAQRASAAVSVWGRRRRSARTWCWPASRDDPTGRSTRRRWATRSSRTLCGCNRSFRRARPGRDVALVPEPLMLVKVRSRGSTSPVRATRAIRR